MTSKAPNPHEFAEFGDYLTACEQHAPRHGELRDSFALLYLHTRKLPCEASDLRHAYEFADEALKARSR